MNDPGANDRLEQLLEQFCVDALSADQWTELQELLAGNREAQLRYSEVVFFREGMTYLLSSIPGDGSFEGDTRQPAAVSLPENPQTPFRPTSFRQWMPSWVLAASITFVACATLALSAYRVFPWNTAPVVDSSRRMHPAASLPRGLQQNNQLGKISGLSIDASADGLLRSTQVGQDLRCGEVLQIATGFIRVQLFSGPELLIEGPAEFSLIGEESVFIRSGRLSAHGGQRLLLQTPLITAECVSARVSFEAADNDSASIFVNEGIVTLMTTPQEHIESEKLRLLRAGEGLLVNPSASRHSLQVTARGPIPGIVQQWQQVEERLSDYQRLVLSDRPLAYWPLVQVQKNHRVLDLTQNGHDGLPIGNWPANLDDVVTDPTGRGVYFNGECYIEPDRKPPIRIQDGFAVEAWAKPQGPPQFQAIFTSRWVLSSGTPSQQCFGITLYAGDTNCWKFWTGRGRYGEAWNVLESPGTINRDEWTHVVGVFTPQGSVSPGNFLGKVHLYVNGRQVIEDVHDASVTDFEWPARIGAAEYVPRYLTSWLFKGFISDVAIYGYPLDATSIKKHYERGKLSVRIDMTDHRLSASPLLATFGKRPSP